MSSRGVKRKRLRWLALFCVAVFTVCGDIFPALPVTPAAEGAQGHVVISEIYGGGGSVGAYYRQDFVELYNPLDEPVDLTGFSVQCTSFNGVLWNVTSLAGSIPARGFYLVQGTGGSYGVKDLPAPDAAGPFGLGTIGGKVALVRNSEPISGKNDPDVVDFVGYGSANEYEGDGRAPAHTAASSTERKAAGGADPLREGGALGNGQDTDNNGDDFVWRGGLYQVDGMSYSYIPEPQNSLSPSEPPFELVFSVTEIEIIPSAITLPPGGIGRIQTIAHKSDGSSEDVTQEAFYTVTGGAVSVDQEGVVVVSEAAQNGTTAIIVAEYEGKTAACHLAVEILNEGEEQVVRVNGIQLDKKELKLKVGEIGILKANVLPDDASDKRVFYTSSAPDIAAVDENGTVCGIGGGTAVITASSADGGYEDRCTVTVLRPNVPRKKKAVEKEEDRGEGRTESQENTDPAEARSFQNKTFADIGGHWAQAQIEELASLGIVRGINENHFAPDKAATRAELATLLVRALGKESIFSNCPFLDVDFAAWYFAEVKKAAGLGVVKGEGKMFRPDDPATREEMAAALINAVGIGCPELDLTAVENLPFRDREEISKWAVPSVSRAYSLGLFQGFAVDSFAPKTTVTRAEAATAVKRLFDLCKGEVPET